MRNGQSFKNCDIGRQWKTDLSRTNFCRRSRRKTSNVWGASYISDVVYLHSRLAVRDIHPIPSNFEHLSLISNAVIAGYVLTMSWLPSVQEAHMFVPWIGTGGKSLFSKTSCSATSWARWLICVKMLIEVWIATQKPSIFGRYRIGWLWGAFKQKKFQKGAGF